MQARLEPLAKQGLDEHHEAQRKGVKGRIGLVVSGCGWQ